MSRAWLYRQDQLRRQIDQLRQTPTSRASRVPAAERATNDSLRQQLRAYRSEIARLRLEKVTGANIRDLSGATNDARKFPEGSFSIFPNRRGIANPSP